MKDELTGPYTLASEGCVKTWELVGLELQNMLVWVLSFLCCDINSEGRFNSFGVCSFSLWRVIFWQTESEVICKAEYIFPCVSKLHGISDVCTGGMHQTFVNILS